MQVQKDDPDSLIINLDKMQEHLEVQLTQMFLQEIPVLAELHCVVISAEEQETQKT